MPQPAILPYGGFLPDRPSRWPSALSLEAFRARFPCESDTVEFKQGVGSLEDSVVAFSNTRGGVIVAGIANDGTITGCPHTPAMEDKIRRALAPAHSIAPLNIRGLDIEERGVTVIGVGQLREGFAQSGNGRVLVRLATNRVALIGGDLVRFMHERMSSSFETVPTDLRLEHADARLLEEVAGALHLSGANREARLLDRGLVANEDGLARLTVAGALYLTAAPQRVLGKAFIELRRFPDGAGARPNRRVEINGPAHTQVEVATALVMSEVGSESVVLGLRRHELPRLPERVVREAIANAVAHRSYEQSGSPIRVDMYPDRTVVTSPGPLVAPVTLETMRDAYAARNANIIRVLRAFRLAEDSGQGVDLIEDLMRDELLAQPTFDASDSWVSVSLPVLSGTRPEERAWLSEVVARGAIEDRDRVLLVHARRGETLSNQRARELLRGVSRDVAAAALQRLVAAGLLERSGVRGGTRYQLAGALAPPAGLRLPRNELLDVVAEMAQAEPVTNATVRKRTGLDRQDVLSLLEELVDTGRLIRVGERRGTHYLPPEAASE
jgi:ATP-dependent DNA helicase RecG